MNKNLIITALLVAVSCQSVSAAVPASMMSKAFTNVSSFVGSHKIATATVGVSALLYGSYKYLSKKVAQWNSGVEKQLDELVVEVKDIVAKAKYVTVDQLDDAGIKKNPYHCIKADKYALLYCFYPEVIKLANDYIIKMNYCLQPNMTHDQRVIAHKEVVKAMHDFWRYAGTHVFLKVTKRDKNNIVPSCRERVESFLLPVPAAVPTDRRRR